jgi:predicted ATP-dependent serine protease
MSEPNAKSEGDRVSTGIPGLDDVLGGGLDPERLYLIEGEPGTGKTTLALQFLLEGAYGVVKRVSTSRCRRPSGNFGSSRSVTAGA